MARQEQQRSLARQRNPERTELPARPEWNGTVEHTAWLPVADYTRRMLSSGWVQEKRCKNKDGSYAYRWRFNPPAAKKQRRRRYVALAATAVVITALVSLALNIAHGSGSTPLSNSVPLAPLSNGNTTPPTVPSTGDGSGSAPSTCAQWNVTGPSVRVTVARSLVGSVNLALRVEGTTAACLNWIHDGMSDTTVAEVITGIAQTAPGPVYVDESKLPPTTDPSDPHQCLERYTDGGASAGTDCAAMGF